jgi:hypothetical protein
MVQQQVLCIEDESAEAVRLSLNSLYERTYQVHLPGSVEQSKETQYQFKQRPLQKST